MPITLLNDFGVDELSPFIPNVGESPTVFVFVTKMGIRRICLYQNSLAFDEAPGKSARLFAEVLNGLLWMMGLGCIDTDQSDFLPSIQYDCIAIDDSGNGSKLSFGLLR
jgi:hypothetical protein